jgi:hypothetical protein
MVYNFNRRKEYRAMRRLGLDNISSPNICIDDEPITNVIIEFVDEVIEKRITKKRYTEIVREMTRQVDKSKIEGYNKDKIITRDMVLSEGRGIFQDNNLLVVDHKISISYGYKNNIPPHHIADISNLRWLPSKDNGDKNSTNYVDDSNRWILNTIE